MQGDTQAAEGGGQMTTRDIQIWLEEIQASVGDDERAHGLEDALFVAVLRAIAEGSPNAQELAKEALIITKFGFERWCA